MKIRNPKSKIRRKAQRAFVALRLKPVQELVFGLRLGFGFRASAFTLIELLVVIAIMGVLAAITVPALKNFKKADATLAGTRKLLADVAYARQLAISQRSTVYMVFCPANFWNDPQYNRLNTIPAPSAPAPTELQKSWKLFDNQINSYTFVTLRDVGDQPGRSTPRYHTGWQTLPEGVFIAPFKFNPPNNYLRITDPSTGRNYDVYGFDFTNNIPFPSEASAVIGPPYVTLPYIAFNYLGQLESGRDEYIPLARGSVAYGRDPNGEPTAQLPSINEQPPGNSTNAYNLIHIDWLTGRARLEQQEISGT